MYAQFLLKPEVTDQVFWFSKANRLRGGFRLHYVKIWRTSEQNYGLESAAYKICKIAAMTSSNWVIQNLRKTTLSHVLKTICMTFHQNQPSSLGYRAGTDIHKDTHTHTNNQTHRYTDTLSRSILIWLNIKTHRNKIAQGDINIFSNFNVSGCVPFSWFSHST